MTKNRTFFVAATTLVLVIIAFIILMTDTPAAYGAEPKPPVQLQHKEDFDGGDEEQWKASIPEQGREPDKVHPPRGSFGFVGCGQYSIWVFLADGKSYRYDSKHGHMRSASEMKTLLDWLNTGPKDVVELDCATSL